MTSIRENLTVEGMADIIKAMGQTSARGCKCFYSSRASLIRDGKMPRPNLQERLSRYRAESEERNHTKERRRAEAETVMARVRINASGQPRKKIERAQAKPARKETVYQTCKALTPEQKWRLILEKTKAYQTCRAAAHARDAKQIERELGPGET
ncbi:Uncharacterised protein [uncultured archaeon]|nr:Uncharacterised protein [uncultured archaeon]